MKTKMDMSSLEIEPDSMEEYGDDILYAGWNPEVGSVNQQLKLAKAAEQQDMSAASRPKVAESLPGRIYSSQQQIHYDGLDTGLAGAYTQPDTGDENV